MICGTVEVQIIDGNYGSPKHGIPKYTAICIGEENEGTDTVRFEAEFNVSGPYYKCHLELGDSLIGNLSLTYQMSDKMAFKKNVLDFIPPDKAYIHDQLIHGRDLVGKGCLCYTRGFTSKPIDIHYQFTFKRLTALVHRVVFTIPTPLLRETARVIHSMETDRLMQI